MGLDKSKPLWIIVLILTCTILSGGNAQKRVFMFIKVTTIQTFTNRNNVGQPISTNSTSFLSCAVHLMQYGPFTCMEYNKVHRICRSNNGEETVNSLNNRITAGWSFYNVQSIGNSQEECKMTDMGKEYRGRTNVTVNGTQCQRWGATSPHDPWSYVNHTLIQEEGYGILTTNYCRNPDDEPRGPWCYTMDPDNRYDFCDVPRCQCYN